MQKKNTSQLGILKISVGGGGLHPHVLYYEGNETPTTLGTVAKSLIDFLAQEIRFLLQYIIQANSQFHL